MAGPAGLRGRDPAPRRQVRPVVLRGYCDHPSFIQPAPRSRRGGHGYSHLWPQLFWTPKTNRFHPVFMAATARKSVHIQGPESTHAPRSRARKNPDRARAGSKNSQRGASDYKVIEQRRPLHSGALNSFRPTHPESHANTKFAARFAGINQEHFSNLTKQILARAYPRECPQCQVPMTAAVARRESVER